MWYYICQYIMAKWNVVEQYIHIWINFIVLATNWLWFLLLVNQMLCNNEIYYNVFDEEEIPMLCIMI